MTQFARLFFTFAWFVLPSISIPRPQQQTGGGQCKPWDQCAGDQWSGCTTCPTNYRCISRGFPYGYKQCCDSSVQETFANGATNSQSSNDAQPSTTNDKPGTQTTNSNKKSGLNSGSGPTGSQLAQSEAQPIPEAQNNGTEGQGNAAATQGGSCTKGAPPFTNQRPGDSPGVPYASSKGGKAKLTSCPSFQALDRNTQMLALSVSMQETSDTFVADPNYGRGKVGGPCEIGPFRQNVAQLISCCSLAKGGSVDNYKGSPFTDINSDPCKAAQCFGECIGTPGFYSQHRDGTGLNSDQGYYESVIKGFYMKWFENGCGLNGTSSDHITDSECIWYQMGAQ